MTKNYLFLCCCCFISNIIIAQNQEVTTDTLEITKENNLNHSPYPKGCYMSLEEILNKTPSKQMEIEIVERPESYASFGGGSKHKLVSLDKKIKKKILKKELSAISDGINLFLNTDKCSDQSWYAQIDAYGYYLSFKTGMGIYRKLYIFNTETGEYKRVDRDNIQFLLAEYPSLVANFEMETDKNSLAVLENYIQYMNTSIEQGFAYQLPDKVETLTDLEVVTKEDTISHIPTPYPKGCYMSLEELLNKTPSKQMDVKMVKRTKQDIELNGGNDYRLISPVQNIKKRVLKKDIWAVSDGTDLFLNGYRHGFLIWYAKVEEYGTQLIFKAAGPPVEVNTGAIILGGVIGGVVGGAIGGAIAGTKAATQRYIYIFHTDTGRLRRVIKKTIPSILADYPDLLEAFEAEEDKQSLELVKAYMQQLNERLNTRK